MKSVCALALAIVLSPGCGGDKDKDKDKKAGSGGESAAGGESAPQSKLVAKVDGKSVTFAGAFGWTMGGKHQIRLSFEAKPTTCAKLRAKSYSTQPTRRFTLFGRVQPDGSTAWETRDKATFTGLVIDTKAGGTIKGSINSTAANANLSGPFEAVSCGDFGYARQLARKNAPTPRPQKLTVTLAGVSFPIQGARVRKTKYGYRLQLDTAPINCKGSIGSDLALRLSLNEDGSPRSVNVGGYALKTSQSLPPSGVQGLEISVNGALAGTGNVTGTVAGEATFRGYKLSFKGGFDALRCTE